MTSSGLSVARRVTFTALPGIPLVQPGDDLAVFVRAGLSRAELALADGDVLVVTSKLFSRAEGRFVDLSTIEVSERAAELAAEVDKDPALVEVILADTVGISRRRTGALIVRHRLGFISANAAVDASNARPEGASEESGPWALRMPEDPDASAERLRGALTLGAGDDGLQLGVVVSDSLGRPFRLGTVGAAVGTAGIPALLDHRGATDLHGRELQYTMTAIADQLAAAADMIAGQSDEGRPIIHVRGLSFTPRASSARELLRDPEQDLYA